jgi:hypothetical protein
VSVLRARDLGFGEMCERVAGDAAGRQPSLPARTISVAAVTVIRSDAGGEARQPSLRRDGF